MKKSRLRIPGLIVLLGIAILALSGLFPGAWGLERGAETAAYTRVASWTEAGGRPLADPFAVAVDPRNGNVLVTDARNQRVVVYEPDGEFLYEFGSTGSGAGEFARPTGIAVDPEGFLYVADFLRDRIQKFTASGEFLLEWGGQGSGAGEFQSPNGVAVDEEGHVYVADFQNSRVQVFTGTGDLVRTIGRPGRVGKGRLHYPTDVKIGPGGRTFVADAYNYRVQVLEPGDRSAEAWGWHLFRLWPRPAGGSNGFRVPTGLAPGDGLVHVADSGNHRMVMLDGEGQFVTEWRIPDPGLEHSPTMAAVSPDGRRVYATDTAGDRIVVLEVKEIE